MKGIKLPLVILVISLTILLIVFFLTKEDNSDSNQDAATVEQELLTDGPPPSPTPIAQVATYEIIFTPTWSEETHPGLFPLNAHFSPFVAYSHEDNIESQIFVENAPATPGIEEMAETGKTVLLGGEVDELITVGAAIEKVVGNRIDVPGSDSAELKFDINHPNLSFVSMLAPSPDWFVGVNSYPLIVDGNWVDSVEIILTTFDAGTDSGTELTSADQNTSPFEGVKVFEDNLQNLGKITVTKVN